MSQIRFNQAFIGLVAAGVLTSFIIPPSITNRAKPKIDILMAPVATPVRGIAGMFKARFGSKALPPGETALRPDAQIAAENSELRQQIIVLKQKLEELQIVQAERKRLGELKLLDDFEQVGVLGGDPSPDRDALNLMPSSLVNFSPGTPVMCPEGLVGRMVEGRRVRLITDRGFIITGEFGRWVDQKWTPLPTPKPSVHGIGRGVMRVENLTMEDARKIKPGDWVIVSDPVDYPKILQGRKIGQVESVQPLSGKPLFAEIIVKPSTDLRQLNEVLVMKK
jgi:cell shape-determining protein MreC